MKKQDAAYKLYSSGDSLEEIAQLLSVKYNTVARWSSNGKWKEKKNNSLMQETTNQEMLRDLFSYQLKGITKMKALYEEQFDEVDNIAELQKMLISKGDIDALQKLHTTIKEKEISWDQLVANSRDLLEYVSEFDIKLSKKLNPIMNEWLNLKREDK